MINSEDRIFEESNSYLGNNIHEKGVMRKADSRKGSISVSAKKLLQHR